MNREIKFRLWNFEEKEMIYPSISFNEKFVLQINCEYMGMLNGKTYDTIKMPKMQYTGLKDKNGKEIYEGDVCQIMMRKKYGHQKDGIPATVGAVEFGKIVVRDESLYVFYAFHIKGGSIQYRIGQELEVIGNIYENPELLPTNNTNNQLK